MISYRRISMRRFRELMKEAYIIGKQDASKNFFDEWLKKKIKRFV